MVALRRKSRVGLATVVLVMGLPFAAQSADPAETKPFSAELTVVSDYIYRGVSLSDGHVAFQASAAWNNAHASVLPGLHSDAWFSTIDFGDSDPAEVELAGTIGYSGGHRVTYDLGLTYTAYPGVAHYDYVEAYGAVGTTLGKATVMASVNYTPSYSGDTGAATFLDLEGEYALTGVIALVGSIGYADLKPAAGDKYAYWGLGVKVTYRRFTASVRYHGNSLNGCASACGDGVTASLSRAF